MIKFFTVRMGGPDVEPGMLPISTPKALADLMKAIQEYGGAAEQWGSLNAHIQIVGKGSTVAAVLGRDSAVRELRPPLSTFCRDVAAGQPSDRTAELIKTTIGAKGLEYLELTADVALEQEEPIRGVTLRFDTPYLEDLKARALTHFKAEEEFHARIVRVGGLTQPTADLVIESIDIRRRAFRVASEALARKLAARLYETVKLRGTATWSANNLTLIDFVVEELDEEWRDCHLADVIEDLGRFPLEPSVASLDELMRHRREG